MKKLLIAIIVIAAISFRPERRLKVELTVEQWGAVLQTIDQSSAPHTDVKVINKWLVDQLQPQFKDTTKKQ